jgi:hypothetical protein
MHRRLRAAKSGRWVPYSALARLGYDAVITEIGGEPEQLCRINIIKGPRAKRVPSRRLGSTLANEATAINDCRLLHASLLSAAVAQRHHEGADCLGGRRSKTVSLSLSLCLSLCLSLSLSLSLYL